MSRIILTKYEDGQERFVVGWDHPAQGVFWQEFNPEPAPDPETGEVDWTGYVEVSRQGGWPGIKLDNFRESVPEDLRPLITDEVLALLVRHAGDPNSGRVRPVDLSGQTRV